MSYPIVTQVPKGSEWKGDEETFVQEGCVKGWGYQVSYGRNIIAAKYKTPDGRHVLLEKYVLNRITEADAWETLKSAGY